MVTFFPLAMFRHGTWPQALSTALGVVSVAATLSAQPEASWSRVTQHAAWQPRDSCGEAVFRDQLWLLGGWYDSFSEPPRDVWHSADGVHWDCATEKAPWRHGDLPTVMAFHDRLWLMAGWHNGRLADATASHEVWSTADGSDWHQETAAAPWSARLGAAGVVFQDRMWILGGVERYYDGDASHLRNDVWNSRDGRTWAQVTAAAEWSPRAYHAALVHDGKLWVLGGGNYQPTYAAANDVWSSSDGTHWTRETSAAAWSPRIWFSAVAWRDQMWVLGGWSNNPFANHQDVWHSANGRDWQALQTPEMWTARHEHSTFVWRDALWVTAGHAAPLANDVWRLDDWNQPRLPPAVER